MSNTKAVAVDESAESEITIAPDGRIYAFGITRGIVEVLAAIPSADDRVKCLLRQVMAMRVHDQTDEEATR